MPDPFDDVFTFSASGIATAMGCMRKASYRYVLNVDTPSGPAAALGSKIHKEMENWFLLKQVPELAPTKRLLPLAPNPQHADVLVEHPFRILLPVGAARGFIDLVVPRPDPKRMPGGVDGGWSPDRPAVFDWKSTSNLVYAKSETDLLKDPQAILYGVAARLVVASSVANVPEVDLQWVYTSTKAAESRPVRVRQTLTILEDGLAEVIATAEKMRGAFEAAFQRQSVDEVEYDLRECDKYGGCPHRAYCVANQCFVATGSGPTLDAEKAVPTVRALPERNAPMADSALLARLRAGSKTPPKVTAPVETAAAPETVLVPETAADVVKPSPEPDLPKVDVSGLDTALPPGSSPVNSPEASPNVSPEDPPAPALVPKAPQAKARKGRRSADDVSAGFVAAVDGGNGLGDLRITLSYNAQKALAEENFALAEKLVAALNAL